MLPGAKAHVGRRDSIVCKRATEVRDGLVQVL